MSHSICVLIFFFLKCCFAIFFPYPCFLIRRFFLLKKKKLLMNILDALGIKWLKSHWSNCGNYKDGKIVMRMNFIGAALFELYFCSNFNLCADKFVDFSWSFLFFIGSLSFSICIHFSLAKLLGFEGLYSFVCRLWFLVNYLGKHRIYN